MASDVDICNMALSLIGREPIADIGESSPEGKACAIFYTHSRDEALRGHPWNFAQTRRALAPVVVPTGYKNKWSHAYAYPGDCLHARAVSSEGTDNIFFEVAQDKSGDLVVLTNVQPAYLSYTKNTKDTTKFDSSFTNVLALKLAANLAIPLTKSPQLEQSMLTKYLNALVFARTVDAKEGSQEHANTIPWLRARAGVIDE